MEITTAAGPAQVEVDEAELAEAELAQGGPARFLLVLTHGAGGGTDSADLLAARQAGLDCGAAVARVLQPYRVRGASAPGSATRQDAAWLEIIGALRERFAGVPLVQGGRSNGARVACRTAQEVGAAGVIALAFPLHPPGRPDKSRLAELRAVSSVPLLVLNGDRDPFGVPDASDLDGLSAQARLVVLKGETHSLGRSRDAIVTAVTSWLGGLGGG